MELISDFDIRIVDCGFIIEFCVVFLIVIRSMQSWTGTTRHTDTRKRSTKRLKHTANLFTKNIYLIGVC